MDIEVKALEAKYVDAARAHAREKLRDAKAANLQHDRLVSAFHELKELGNQGWLAIRNLTRHDEPEVRLWAATHLLQVEPQIASGVLEELSQLAGFVGFEAGIVLSEWRAGRLTWA
jgi:hypothetical protein